MFKKYYYGAEKSRIFNILLLKHYELFKMWNSFKSFNREEINKKTCMHTCITHGHRYQGGGGLRQRAETSYKESMGE